jgi:hypothetical protein
VLLKLPWLAVEVFTDVLGEIPGQFDRRGSRPWSSHIHLPLCLSDNLVSSPTQEANILKSADNQMGMDRSPFLTFQHRHVRHSIVTARQHAS